MHISSSETRRANLLGGLAVAVTDRLRGDSRTAALIHIRLRPAESIDFLARVLGISHPATVRLVDRLAGEGLVERRPGSDARCRALVLTEAGEAAAAGELGRRAAVLGDVLTPLSAHERQQLERLLVKLLAGLTADPWSARHICRLCDFPACEDPFCPVDRAVVP